MKRREGKNAKQTFHPESRHEEMKNRDIWEKRLRSSGYVNTSCEDKRKT